MQVDNQKKWPEMSHEERIQFIEELNKQITFSLKLLEEYLHELKKSNSKNNDFIEEAYKDRLIIIEKRANGAIQLITKK